MEPVVIEKRLKGDFFMDDTQHVFLIGAKSLGVYGGYETFVSKLTEYHQNDGRIQYHVACKANGDGCMDPYQTRGAVIISEKEFIYHKAHCFRISVPEGLGPAQAVYYDAAAMKECCRMIEEQRIKHPIVYIMACRMGLLIKKYYKKIHKLGGRVYLNPDGHEWMRKKWPVPVRWYWKLSEGVMVRYSDLTICDSLAIESYIHKCYDGKGFRCANPETTFIAYGAETRKSRLSDDDRSFVEWKERNGLDVKKYYLAVGRFVPENNYEVMVREFMKSETEKDFVIITTENDKLLKRLEKKLGVKGDNRIKFVGAVYDQELLKKIRESAFGYFHGHEVGGTNPSLLEALGSTKLNLLLDVGFNREVAGKAALYWNKENGSLARLIDLADQMKEEEIESIGERAKERIIDAYSWKYICGRYAEVFLEG